MEPRKVRKLKVLTGFRPVSDLFQTCFTPFAQLPQNHGTPPAKKWTKRETQRKERNSTKTRLLSMSKSIVKGKLQEAKASKECLNWMYLRCEKPRTPAPGSQNTAKKEAHLQEQQTRNGTKAAFNLWSYKNKTPCAMIQTSAWQRLCVCSPEVTGSCLVTSVACTMEPRKIRKLKVFDRFQTCFRPFAQMCQNPFLFYLTCFFFF